MTELPMTPRNGEGDDMSISLERWLGRVAGPRWATPFILGATLLLAACGGSTPEQAPRDMGTVQARTEPAGSIPWESVMEVTARVEPYRRSAPGTVLMGRVEKILRREGDRAAAGQVLATIESREITARLSQAEAQVAAARAQEENARIMRERMERLHPRNAASRRDLDDAVAGHETALAQLRAAEEGVKAARVTLDHAQVRAPFAGVITARHVEAGDMAAPGMPLFIIEDLSRMKVEAEIPESSMRGLEPGGPVEVRIEAASEPVRTGMITEILPAGDPRSHTFTLRVVVENRERDLRPGMFARIRLVSGAGEALAVPETALVRRGPLNGLFVVDEGGVARLRWVTLGESRAGLVEILTGLTEGERFVTEPPAGLADGMKVAAS